MISTLKAHLDFVGFLGSLRKSELLSSRLPAAACSLVGTRVWSSLVQATCCVRYKQRVLRCQDLCYSKTSSGAQGTTSGNEHPVASKQASIDAPPIKCTYASMPAALPSTTDLSLCSQCMIPVCVRSRFVCIGPATGLMIFSRQRLR